LPQPNCRHPPKHPKKTRKTNQKESYTDFASDLSRVYSYFQLEMKTVFAKSLKVKLKLPHRICRKKIAFCFRQDS
jgi:hypothetical protein